MGEGQLSEICDTMHCKLGNHRRVFIIHERLQLLCFNLQALTTSDWIQVLLSLLLTSVLPPFHHYVFGFSFHCLVLQELLLLRVHHLVNLNKVFGEQGLAISTLKS